MTTNEMNLPDRHNTKVTLIEVVTRVHECTLFQLDSGEYTWTCHPCGSWGYGALQESAALTEIADHVSLFCEER